MAADLQFKSQTMSIDCRTRLHSEFRKLSCDEVFDSLFPEAIDQNGELAAHGVRYNGLPPLRFVVGDRGVSLRERDGPLHLDENERPEDTMAELGEKALSELDFSMRFKWMEPTPKVAAYVERIRQRPAYQSSHGSFGS